MYVYLICIEVFFYVCRIKEFYRFSFVYCICMYSNILIIDFIEYFWLGVF